MPFIKPKCPTCAKTLEVAQEFKIGEQQALLTKCGHVVLRSALSHKDPSNVTSIDGKTPYKFQAETVKFMEDSGGRVLIAHEMGLGKTICVQTFLACHPECNPTLFIVKSSLKTQWQHEIMRWQGEEVFAQIIEDTKTHFIPGLKAYIISFDLIPRFENCPKCNHEGHGIGTAVYIKADGTESHGNCTHRSKKTGALDCDCAFDSSDRANFLKAKMVSLGIKTIIIDECQQIKNTDANRTQSIRYLCDGIDNIFALSGTPIKNHAAEYFSILNILRPDKFNNLTKFIQNDCDSYNTGYGYKVGGLRDPEDFKRKTSDFIIRYERTEVMPDLPTITRNFQFSDLGTIVEKEYKLLFSAFQDAVNDGEASGLQKEANILSYISKMRHVTGKSKIDPCIDFVMEFLGSCDRRLCIFIHHQDVGEILMFKLKSLMAELGLKEPLALVSSLDSAGRARVVDQFMNQGHRVLVASTLASGEGLNLQKCSDCIMLERQWNPANEEQAEGRFIRIGQTSESVTATYMVAVGTVDEFFSEIVEKKRQYVNQTMNGEAIEWDQSSLMKELTETLYQKGGQRWGL